MAIPTLYGNGIALATYDTTPTTSYAYGTTVTITSSTLPAGWTVSAVSLVSKPAGSVAVPSSATTLPATVTLDKGGRYRVRVILAGPGGLQSVAFGALVAKTANRALELLDEQDDAIPAATRDRLNRFMVASDTTALISGARTLTTFAAVRAAATPAPLDGDQITVSGRATINDGFAGVFAWVAASTAADDNADTLQITGVTTGRWVRLNQPSGSVADGAVTTAKLAGGAVTAGKLASASVSAVKHAANVVHYGTAANAQHVTDGAITSGTTALTSATGSFAAGDVGKRIRVAGAGAAGADLFTTIAAFVSATSVTLTAAASGTVSGANVVWGTDDSAAFQAAFNAWSGTGEGVLIPPGNYLIATPVSIPSNLTIIGSDGAVIWSHLVAGPDQNQTAFVAFAPAPLGQGTISTTPTRTNSVAVNGWTGAAPAKGQVLGLFSGQTLHTFDIQAVSGTGPYTLTLDRAIAHPFVSTNPANTYATQPHDIRIHGNGMRFRGPCDRYIELGATNRGYIEDCHVDMVGGGSVDTGGGAFSWDTGSRNVGYKRCTIDMTGNTVTSSFGLGLESVDHGFIEDCRVTGADIGFYLPDCIAPSVVGCYATGCGKLTGTGSGFLVGKAVGGLGCLGSVVAGCFAINCQNAYSIGAQMPSIRGVTAVGCVCALNVNADSVAVEAVDLTVSECTQIAVLAVDTTIHGLRATALAGAPAYGLIACTGGTSRIYDAKIVSTAATFVAAAIKTSSTGSVEVYDTTITLADAANGYGLYGTSGTVKVRNLTVNGSATGGVRLDAGLSGYIGPDCDFSVAALPIFATGNAGWRMQPTGREGSISMADGNKTATYAQTYVDVLRCTGAITANRTLTLAFNALGHIWTINNATTGGFSVLVSFGSGATVTCGAGITRVYWDGTNAVQA